MPSLAKQYEMQQLNDAAKQSLKNLPPPPPPSYDLLPEKERAAVMATMPTWKDFQKNWNAKGQLESTKEGKSLITPFLISNAQFETRFINNSS